MQTKNSKSLYLRDLIKSTLQEAGVPVYENEAPEGAVYPYIVFEVSTNNAEEYPATGYLEINAWDRHGTFSRVDYIMDQIEKVLKFNFFRGDHVMFRAFDGDRAHIPDEDKQVKRTREKFILRYTTRGE